MIVMLENINKLDTNSFIFVKGLEIQGCIQLFRNNYYSYKQTI